MTAVGYASAVILTAAANPPYELRKMALQVRLCACKLSIL